MNTKPDPEPIDPPVAVLGMAGLEPTPAAPVAEQEPPLRDIRIQICQACLDGVGSECHTAGCALWLHKVDLPIDSNLYEVLDDTTMHARLAAVRAICEHVVKGPSHVRETLLAERILAVLEEGR